MEEDNPTIGERLAVVEADVKWLKRGYWIQTLLSISTFISVLGLIVKLVGGV